MNLRLFLVFCLFLTTAALAAIGYTSAYVETNKQVAAELLEEEDNYKIEDGYGGSGVEASAPGALVSYDKARELQLALPTFDPVSDAASRLIYSLMDVILMRFKQQLFISFITQWKEELLSSEYRYLFPNLAGLLTSIDSSNFLSSFDLWQSAIKEDLRAAPWGTLSFTYQLRKDDPQLSAEERSLLNELNNLMEDIYTFRHVSNLDEFILVSTSRDTQHSQFFRLIGLVAKNMLDEEGGLVLEDLASRAEDPHWLGIYLQKVQADLDGLSLNNDSFRLTRANFPSYLDSCSAVLDFFAQLSAPERVADPEAQTTGEYLKLYLNTCDKLLIKWSRLASSYEGDWDEYYRLFTEYRFKLAGMARQVDEHDDKALLNTLITTTVDLAREKGYITLSYGRMLNLVSTIALTPDSAEVNYRDIMDATLEPVGSYSYKRQADFSVVLNSYPGLGGGAETLSWKGTDAKAVAGLSCPVGLELNFGRNSTAVRGVFLSAFDLGAVASYRFTAGDSLDRGAPQIGWKQLVSPGFYLLLQKREHPITLGLGLQLTPDLRQIKENSVKVEKNALRLGAFVSVDIPLFTFYVKHDWMRNSKARSDAAARVLSTD